MQATLPVVQSAPATVERRYSVQTIPETWVLTEDKVSEPVPHDRAADAEEERTAKEQERALREALEREVLELRAKLGAREAR